MTFEEKQIINEFYFNRITEDEFLKFYPVNFCEDKRYIFQSTQAVHKNKNTDELDLVLTLINLGICDINTDEFIELLCLLLKEKWHKQHENISSILQFAKSPKSIDTLYDTAITKFDYLDYDDSIPLAIKCIHALGEIKTPYAKEKLEMLAASGLPVIQDKAKKQLSYYQN